MTCVLITICVVSQSPLRSRMFRRHRRSRERLEQSQLRPDSQVSEVGPFILLKLHLGQGELWTLKNWNRSGFSLTPTCVFWPPIPNVMSKVEQSFLFLLRRGHIIYIWKVLGKTLQALNFGSFFVLFKNVVNQLAIHSSEYVIVNSNQEHSWYSNSCETLVSVKTGNSCRNEFKMYSYRLPWVD